MTSTIVGTCCRTDAAGRFAVKQLGVIVSLLTSPVTGAARGALYRLAASLPGVRYSGSARDQLGRRGVSVTVGTPADQMRMVFDPKTGEFLGSSMSFGERASAAGYGPVFETVKLTGIRRFGVAT
jgi:hypothetical protein